MSNKNRKFGSNAKLNSSKRVVRHMRFDRRGHLIDTMLKPENSSMLEFNLNQAINFSTTEVFEEVQEFIFNDEEISKAFGNTIIVDNAGQEVNEETKAEARRKIVYEAVEDAIAGVIANKNGKCTKKAFFQNVKDNTLDRLEFLRNKAEKDKEKTQEDSSLFSRFSKKIKVYGRDILSMFKADEKATKAYEQKITDNAPTVKSKVLWNKCKKYKYQIAAGIAGLLLVTACATDSNKKATEKKVDQTEKTAKPTPAKKAAATKSTPAAQKTIKDAATPVQIDTLELSDRTKLYFGDKLEIAMKRLSSSIMEKFPGMTPAGVLNQVAYDCTFYEEATICKWEDAVKGGTKDEAAQAKIKAYRVAQMFKNYLIGCNDTIPENLSDIVIPQVGGNRNVAFVGVKRSDCGEETLQYKSTAKKQKTEPPADEEETTAEETATNAAQSPTNFADGATGSTEFKKQNVQNTSTVDVEATNNMSNEAYGDRKELNKTDIQNVLDSNVKDRVLYVEVTKTKVAKDSATYNIGNSLKNGETIAQVTNEAAASVNTNDTNLMVEQDEQAKAPTNLPTGFKDLNADTQDEQAKAPTNLPTGFKDLNADAQDEQVQDPAPQPTKTAVADSTSSKVFEGLEGVELGTPALGNVAPRDGYNHTGVKVNSPEYTIKFLGGEAQYKDAIENGNNHPELFARGGAAEGWNPQILAEITAVYSEVFPYKDVTLDLRKLVICGDTLSAERLARVKDAIDNVNIDHTIDGVTYNLPKRNTAIKDNGCDEKPTPNIVATNDTKITRPSGKKYGRYFVADTAPRGPQGFGTGAGSVEEVNLQQIIDQAASFTYNMSNQNFEDSMKLSDVDVSKVLGKKLKKDPTIWVEVSDKQQSGSGIATRYMSNEGYNKKQQITTLPLEEVPTDGPKNNPKLMIQTGVALKNNNQKG